MEMFKKLFSKREELPELHVKDTDIVAMADGEMKDVKSVSDPIFAEEIMGKTVAFQYCGDKVVLCAPANGTLTVMFPTGHAFGMTTKDNVEILVHCGINTVRANGDGFLLKGKKGGDAVKAGEPIVEVDIKKLSKKYDMSTMLIITDDGGKNIDFVKPKKVIRGESLIVS